MKIHLLISVEPIVSGQDLEAICGATVIKAQAVPLNEMGPQESSFIFCKACFGRQYFYAIGEGQLVEDLKRE